MPTDPNEIGALWDKTNARGPYMTGVINGERVVVFQHDGKGNAKAPNWRVLKARPKPASPDTHKPDDDVRW